jgi:4-hydroxy-2-oxoheptanedioate aldolase
VTLRTKLDGTDLIVSTFSMLKDSMVAELTGAAGFDCVIVDMQHGFATFSELPAILQAYAITDTPVVVRIPGHSYEEIGRVLDWGADGVVLPLIDTAEQAAAAVRAVRYPPVGDRSFGPVRAALRNENFSVESANSDLVLVAMIETPTAMANLEEIAKVPGIDVLLIGPADLTVSHGLPLAMGGPGAADNPALDEMIERVADVCKVNGIVAGIAGSSAAAVRKWYPRGYRFITVAGDFLSVRAAAASAVVAAHAAAAGDGQESDEAGSDPGTSGSAYS